ncbi:TetR/AcrR family transcriptional regulator [Occultella gossypii]|uniref:TetR/AcrR family transcriptional regulator n=1 Tax=Occultella gossypii TaxID=2800820 RepID=A0ABS7S4T4_9MICO|nr:TetR/AcrR family transcriptional regulator [Occultella gossypii]MBZ2195305.1 TetR/AcrR family transcriptional regulator [Occultella gossypii]
MARGPGAQHDAQITQLADAAVRVLERDGLPALTFRNVAAEAGVSPGRVQHYLQSSKGLATATFRRVQELVGDGVRRELEEGPTSSPREVVAATLRAMIPLTEQERSMLRVAFVVEQHAITDPELGEELRVGRMALVEFLAQQLAAADVSGDGTGRTSDADGTARRTAITLLATAEGLSALTLTGTVSGEEARKLLAESMGRALA